MGPRLAIGPAAVLILSGNNGKGNCYCSSNLSGSGCFGIGSGSCSGGLGGAPGSRSIEGIFTIIFRMRILRLQGPTEIRSKLCIVDGRDDSNDVAGICFVMLYCSAQLFGYPYISGFISLYFLSAVAQKFYSVHDIMSTPSVLELPFFPKWHVSQNASRSSGLKANTKEGIAEALADGCDEVRVTKAVVSKLLDHLAELATAEVAKGGMFTVPGIASLKKSTKPATKAGNRVVHGKRLKVKATPARTIVKAFVDPILEATASSQVIDVEDSQSMSLGPWCGV